MPKSLTATMCMVAALFAACEPATDEDLRREADELEEAELGGAEQAMIKDPGGVPGECKEFYCGGGEDTGGWGGGGGGGWGSGGGGGIFHSEPLPPPRPFPNPNPPPNPNLPPDIDDDCKARILNCFTRCALTNPNNLYERVQCMDDCKTLACVDFEGF